MQPRTEVPVASIGRVIPKIPIRLRNLDLVCVSTRSSQEDGVQCVNETTGVRVINTGTHILWHLDCMSNAGSRRWLFAGGWEKQNKHRSSVSYSRLYHSVDETSHYLDRLQAWPPLLLTAHYSVWIPGSRLELKPQV